MTKNRTTSFFALSLAALAALGCNRDAWRELFDDNSEVETLEQSIEGSLEESLSGTATDAESDLSTADEAAESARENAGYHFTPAGCIKSTRTDNEVVHEITNCTGPRGQVINGTVLSTWRRSDNGFGVTHDAEELEIGQSSLSHLSDIEYERVDGVVVRTRSSTTTGTTESGEEVDHVAEFEVVYDPQTGCYKRNGSANTQVGAREWRREVEGWEACGERNSCPFTGTISMEGPRGDGLIDITAPGTFDLTFNDRTHADRTMRWCTVEE